MTKSLVKKPSGLKLPVFNGKSGHAAGIRPDSNRSMLDAADGFTETTRLYAEPANAEQLHKLIDRYRAGRALIRKH